MLTRRHWVSSIGVDIGHDAIKVVQLEERDGVLSVRAAGKERFPAGLRLQGRWSFGRYRFAVDALRGLLRAGGFRGQWASMALGGEAVEMGYVRLGGEDRGQDALGTEREDRGRDALGTGRGRGCAGLGAFSEEALFLAARRELGLRAQASVSYVATGPVREGSGWGEGYVTFGVGASTLSDRLALLEEAGLRCRALEPVACAVGECFAGRQEGGFQVVVDMGQETTTVVLWQGGRLGWARELAVGGGELTEKVAERLGLAWREAEALRWGLQADAAGGDEATRRMVADVSRNLVEEVAVEVESCLRRGEETLGAAGEVILTGGEGCEAMGRLLGERLGRRVRVGDCFVGLADRGQDARGTGEQDVGGMAGVAARGEWAVAMGLCLMEQREAERQNPEILSSKSETMLKAKFKCSKRRKRKNGV